MQIRNVRGDTSPLDFGQCNEVTYFISRPAHLRKISFAAASPRVWPPRQNYNAPRPHIYKIMAEGRKEGRKAAIESSLGILPRIPKLILSAILFSAWEIIFSPSK